MNARKTRTLTGVAVSLIALCGHGPADAGIDAGGVLTTYKGSLSALGGVHVNGIRFSTDSASFLIDGEPGSELDLEVGKVVTVLGALDDDGDTGTAFVVVYESIVDGPADSVDAASGRLTVLGQPVIVTTDTHVNLGDGEDTLASLLPGQPVEVSGYPDADGGIVATFIGRSRSPDSDWVTGTVTTSDTSTMSLTINGLEVDYSQAGLVDVPDGIPAVGERLDIRGALDPATGRLLASRVEATPDGIDAGGIGWQIDGIDAGGISWGIDGIDAGGIDGIDAGGTDGIDAGGTDGIDAGGIDGIDAGGIDGIDAGGIDGIDAGGVTAEIEGYVQRQPESSMLTVDGTDVKIDAGTEFVNGLPDNLGPNAKVEVRGAVNADGVMTAQSIEFERSAEERCVGYVEAKLGDELTVAGITGRLTPETAFSDRRDVSVREFSADGVYVGDAVVLLGYASDDGFIITRLDRHNSLTLHDDHSAIEACGIAGSDD